MPHSLLNQKALLSITALSALAFTATGCGSSSVANLLSGVSATTSVQNGDLMASISAEINMNGFILSSLNLPIIDPSNPTVDYGQITLAPTLCSGAATCISNAKLTLSVDLTTVAKVTSTGDTLPNGTIIPLSGLSTSTVALAIGNTGGKVYIDLTSTVALVGVAFPFQQLNSVGEYVPGLDIFDALTYGDVTAYIGVFAGSATDQTGVALFADLSKVVFGSTPAVAAQALEAHGVASTASTSSSTVQLKATSHSSYEEYELFSQLDSLGSKHTALSLSQKE
jgi:hypothetical protein